MSDYRGLVDLIYDQEGQELRCPWNKKETAPYRDCQSWAQRKGAIPKVEIEGSFFARSLALLKCPEIATVWKTAVGP